ncbi:GNAT family N-acetyltransferase [Lactiplantibacillus fabifermentans]|uniref:Acetyltransferase n=2 Tax=Lactiplantibacillus fabifermentans TaxID=483011 RepID=A0A0R2NFX0_9LACO|nr:GNAT family N-acetyltransferase [Lactiplantibacillus fabifermentans]ETY75460.1 GNAT family acetyltransferase [Lactiplantibacillus fabifermentans T30PCM01]KRO24708.1 acetyltransferase [Lactiplantibacillus fabifermentans DSM 21115]
MWSIKTFSELTTTELYAIYQLRVKTFVVEQQRLYQEVDDIDPHAVHIFKTVNNKIVAYARVFMEDGHASFGRVVVDQSLRGQHLGQQLMVQVMTVLATRFTGQPIIIEAQVQVQNFYTRFGFTAEGTPFIFHHTEHIKMVRAADTKNLA